MLNVQSGLERLCDTATLVPRVHEYKVRTPHGQVETYSWVSTRSQDFL